MTDDLLFIFLCISIIDFIIIDFLNTSNHNFNLQQQQQTMNNSTPSTSKILIVDPVLKLIPPPGNENQPYDDFKIEVGINKIGRASSNGIYLKGDPSVSNYHALLEFNGTFFLIRDLGSLNKTLLQYRPNDPTQVLKPNVSHPITNGSKITFGSATMILSYLEVRANNDYQQEINPVNQPLPQQPLPEKFSSFTSPLGNTLLPPQQKLLQQQLLQQQQKIDQLPIQPPSPPLHHTPSKSSSTTTTTTLPISPKVPSSPKAYSSPSPSPLKGGSNNNSTTATTTSTTTTTTTSAPITPKKDIEMNDINNVNINKRKESEISTSSGSLDIPDEDEDDSNVVISGKKQKHDTINDEIDTTKQSPVKQQKQSPVKQQKQSKENKEIVEESDEEISLSPELTESQEKKEKEEQEERELKRKKKELKQQEKEEKALKKQQEKERKVKEKADKAKIKEDQETTSQGSSESDSSYSGSNSGSNSGSTPSKKKTKPPKDEYISNLLSTAEPLSLKRKTVKPERLEDHYISLNENSNHVSDTKHTKKASTTTNTTSTSNNNKNISSNIKILFSMFSEETAKELESILLKLGGSMASNSSECTHLVSDEMKRSKKILECVSFGKQIVTSKWLKESKKQGYFVDESPYHLNDKKAEAEWDFNLEKSLKIARDRMANSNSGGGGGSSSSGTHSSSSFGTPSTPSSKPLFNNLVFYITKNSIPPKDFLKDIIEINGGILLDDISTVEEDDTKDINIIANAEKDKRFFKKWSDLSYKILKGDFILLSILSQSLVYEGCEI